MRLQRKGVAGGLLRTAVVAAFLEAEGQHSQHIRISRHVRGPGRPGAGDTAPQDLEFTLGEVRDMAGLDRPKVARDDGRASCRERVCQYGLNSVFSDPLKK